MILISAFLFTLLLLACEYAFDRYYKGVTDSLEALLTQLKQQRTQDTAANSPRHNEMNTKL